MSLSDVTVASAQSLGNGFTFFICYGRLAAVEIDEHIQSDAGVPIMISDEIIEHKYGRKLVVVAASTGTDAHTVGLNAILSRKGVAGDPGFESYSMVQTINLGSQVPNEELVQVALANRADAVLISQFVTQGDHHLRNLEQLRSIARDTGLDNTALLIVGGPRIIDSQVRALGFDAGFGPGTIPSQVLSFICENAIAKTRDSK